MPRLATAIASGTEMGPSSIFLGGTLSPQIMAGYGLGSPASERWKSLSVTANAHRVRAPLLLNVPDHELIGSLHPFTALREAGRAVEMYVFPNEYHAKWQPRHRLAVYERNIDWMNFWLRSREDDTPEKAGQYLRWRELRKKQCALFEGDAAPAFCR